MLLNWKFGPIPITRLVLTTLFMLFVNTALPAGEITVYENKDGVITLTDRPAPADARIDQVIHYKEKSAAELAEQQTVTEQKRRAAEQQQEALHIQNLKEKAVQARAEAEREGALAREKVEAAEAYLERYKQKRRSQRRRHQKTAKRVVQEAEGAQAQANAAINRANQAEEALRKASVGLTDQGSLAPTDQDSAKQAGPTSGGQMGKEK